MLTDAEYAHIMKNWSLLKDSKRDCKEQMNVLSQKMTVVKADLDRLGKEELVYTNQLNDAIKEYEKAHPPEEPK